MRSVGDEVGRFGRECCEGRRRGASWRDAEIEEAVLIEMKEMEWRRG